MRELECLRRVLIRACEALRISIVDVSVTVRWSLKILRAPQQELAYLIKDTHGTVKVDRKLDMRKG